MEYLIEAEVEKLVFRPACKFDLCPILYVMSYPDKYNEQPHIQSVKEGGNKKKQTPDNNTDVKEEPFWAFDLERVDLVKLKKEIPD